MFKLFGKKESASPEDRLSECRRKRDWAGLCRAYYDLGVAAMDRGDLNHAQLWLHRADTIYSAQDAIYDKVGEPLVDDCSDRIGRLEDTHILYNDVPAQVAEKAEGLGGIQVRVWGLLSLARLVKLGDRPGMSAVNPIKQPIMAAYGSRSKNIPSMQSIPKTTASVHWPTMKLWKE